MTRRFLRRAAILALVLASGCIENRLTTPSGQLQTAWSKWALTHPASYQMTYQKLCFCGETRAVIIVFRNGAIESAKYLDTGATAPTAGLPSVDDVFNIINDAVSRNAATINASYDATLGYPVSVFIDYFANAADDELTITISNFTPL